MSKYTTEVRFLCERLAGLDESEGYNSVQTILNNSYDKVFSFDFPIYDEAYRPVLCKKILKHYYTREIGEETVGLWKLRLDTRMNEIMPYYNQLYESALLEFDPLHDTDLSKTYTKTGNSEREGQHQDEENRNGGSNAVTTNENVTENQGTDGNTHTGNNRQWNVFSDTPQGALTRVDEETYLTDARKVTDTISETDAGNFHNNGTESNEGSENRTYEEEVGRNGTYGETINSTDEYVERLVGKSSGVSFSKLLQEYRDTLLNIDVMIINDLADLFMNIW